MSDNVIGDHKRFEYFWMEEYCSMCSYSKILNGIIYTTARTCPVATIVHTHNINTKRIQNQIYDSYNIMNQTIAYINK